MHSFAAVSSVQRGANVSKNNPRLNHYSGYQVQQNSASRQLRRAKVTPSDELTSCFGSKSFPLFFKDNISLNL